MAFKASTFLGLFSLRNGCIAACILQLGLGILIWKTLDYLRPMLMWFNITIMLWFVLGSVLGLYGVLTRSELVTWIYLIQLGSCATILFLLCLDFCGIIHFLPKPPAAPTVPITPPVVAGAAMLGSAVAGEVTSIANSAAHAVVPGINTAQTPAFFLTPGFLNFRRVFDYSKRRPTSFVANYKTLPTLSHSLMALKFREAKQSGPTTEGAREEVSRDEMAPETASLPVNLQKQVSATTKSIKHVSKMVMSGVLAVSGVFLIYCSWIVFSFVLNKCTSLDELTDQPEQFEPILQAGSFGTIYTHSGTMEEGARRRSTEGAAGAQLSGDALNM